MSNTNNIKLGTLAKIEYTDLPEFIDMINRNFAVIQNSPMFRGIPGDKGTPGEPGSEGQRGSKLLFLEFDRFLNASFAGISDTIKLKQSSDLNLTFLNTLLKNNKNREILYSLLRIDRLVDGDTLILPDNGIVYYNYPEQIFVHTYKYIDNSGNGNSSIIINEILSEVRKYISENIKTPIVKYDTKVKLNDGTGNVSINDSQKNLGFLVPLIPGKTPEDGEDLKSHQYYGYQYQESTSGTTSYDRTMILGDVLDFYNILVKTLSTQINGRNGNLTEKYSINRNHIPSLVVLQNRVDNAGIFLGSRNAKGIHEFTNIYNKVNALYIDVNVSNNDNDKVTRLILGKNQLVWNTESRFLGKMELENNLEITGNIQNDNILTGNYAIPYSTYLRSLNIPDNDIRRGIQTLIGNNIEGSNLLFGSETVKFENKKFASSAPGKSIILTTDNRGIIETKHTKDDSTLTSVGTSFTTLTPIPGTDEETKNTIITGYHYNNLLHHINLLHRTGVDGLYWSKSDWPKNIIPVLKLNDSLSVDNTVNFGTDKFRFDKVSDLLNIATNIFSNNSPNTKFTHYPNRVLVTDSSGWIRKDISVDFDFQNIPLGLSSMVNQYPTANELLTGQHFKYLNDQVHMDIENLKNNYWTKQQFENSNIPNIVLNNRIISKSSLLIGPGANLNTNISENKTSGTLSAIISPEFSKINSTDIWFDSVNIRLQHLPNNDRYNLLGFENKPSPSGELKGYLKSYFAFNEIPENISIIENKFNANYIANGLTIKSLLNRLNELRETIRVQITTAINQLSQQLNEVINTKLNPLINDVNDLKVKVQTNTTNINKIGIVDTPTPNTIVGHHRTELNNLHTKTDQTNQNLTNLTNNFNTLLQRFNALEINYNTKIAEFEKFKLETVQLPKGAIILWEGYIEGLGNSPLNIPEGWEEVKSLRGRFPVGWSNFEQDKEFKKLIRSLEGEKPEHIGYADDTEISNNLGSGQWDRGFGGAKYHTLNTSQLPSHDHTPPIINENINYYGRSTAKYLSVIAGTNSNIAGTTRVNTDRMGDHNAEYVIGLHDKSGVQLNSFMEKYLAIQNVGNNKPHNNLPPYKVVMFLRSKKGIEPKR